MILLKICGIALISAFSSVILKQIKADIAFLPATAGIVCVVVLLMGQYGSDTVATLKEMMNLSGMGRYIYVLFKALGISYISVFTAEACRSAGEELAAKATVVAAKAEIMLICIPLVSELIGISGDLL